MLRNLSLSEKKKKKKKKLVLTLICKFSDGETVFREIYPPVCGNFLFKQKRGGKLYPKNLYSIITVPK